MNQSIMVSGFSLSAFYLHALCIIVAAPRRLNGRRQKVYLQQYLLLCTTTSTTCIQYALVRSSLLRLQKVKVFFAFFHVCVCVCVCSVYMYIYTAHRFLSKRPKNFILERAQCNQRYFYCYYIITLMLNRTSSILYYSHSVCVRCMLENRIYRVLFVYITYDDDATCV